jgi:hypothetical protein
MLFLFIQHNSKRLSEATRREWACWIWIDQHGGRAKMTAAAKWLLLCAVLRPSCQSHGRVYAAVGRIHGSTGHALGTGTGGGTLPTCQGRSQAPCRCGVWAATERRRRSLWRVREAAGGRWGAAGCLLGAATKMHRQPRGGDGAAVTS